MTQGKACIQMCLTDEFLLELIVTNNRQTLKMWDIGYGFVCVCVYII